MSDNTVNIITSPVVRATLIIRNATAAEWAEKNPKLAKGELGAETDTYLMKMGDGVNDYNDLPYLGLTIDKIIELLPIASQDKPGLVMSSDEDNAVNVDADGKMEVNNISVSKLFVDEGTEFIISAGSSLSVL